MKNSLLALLVAVAVTGTAASVSAQEMLGNKSEKKVEKAEKKAEKGKGHKAAKKIKKAEDKAEVGR